MVPLPVTDEKLKEFMSYKNRTDGEIVDRYYNLIKEGNHNAARRLRCYASYWHLHLFIYFYLEDLATSPFADYHKTILNAIPHGERNRRINILAPRGSSKTTLLTLVYPLHRILYAPFDAILGYHTEKFITIITFSETNAKNRLRGMIYVLETKKEIRADFGERRQKGATWGVKEFFVRSGIGDELIYVLGVTRGGEVRGNVFYNARPTLIILDDIDKVDLLLNPENRAKDQDWFFASVMPAGEPGVTNFIVIDTLKHEESLAALLMDRAGWRTIFLRAIISPQEIKPHPTAETLWKKWENYYANRMRTDEERKAEALKFYNENKEEMERGVESLWPARLTYYNMRTEIVDLGLDFVMREYQNDISHTTFRIFDMHEASEFEIDEKGLLVSDWRLTIKDEEEGLRRVKWDDIAGVSIYHDWAGGQEVLKNDYAAIVAVAWHKKISGVTAEFARDTMNGQYGYVLHAWLDRVPQSQQIRKMFDIVGEVQEVFHHVRDLQIRVGYEMMIDNTGTANDSYQRNFRLERDNRGRGFQDLSIQAVSQSGVQKLLRITAMEGPVAYGQLSFFKHLDPEFIRQMSQFPGADHDDGPDALQGSLRQSLRPFRKDRDRFAPQDEWTQYTDQKQKSGLKL